MIACFVMKILFHLEDVLCPIHSMRCFEMNISWYAELIVSQGKQTSTCIFEAMK